ncbi:NUDIX hydrolase [Terribacillus saccharophilus]|uniref:NUDIX hydrolase n=1 Tax=Terribacillus saccharophilus TaxID=361277 RepID=UPI00298A06CB|nr:NUDIX domain-containing protein [Terribacillus saccharophilus]MCM3225457.1 NUDIX domain-containing protein [Terribacillus saccharophilus]
MELLTIFDEQHRELGVKEREEVHRDGDWHETFHCWFVEHDGTELYIYLQQRSFNKSEFPGKYDITAAGHLESGETPVVGGLREVQEELGVTLQESDLFYKGIIQEELFAKNLIDREFCHQFFYYLEELPDILLNEEVEQIVRMRVNDLEKLVEGKAASVEADIVAGAPRQRIEVAREALCPHQLVYYREVLMICRT